MSHQVIRPGLLVSLKTTVSGGVAYKRVDLDAEEVPGGPVVTTEERAARAAAVARWETTRTISDPEDHDRAITTRSAAAAAIRRVCAKTSFGLLCPEGSEAKLDAAVEAARTLVSEHNATSKLSRVEVFVLKGRIASTDEEAARAIASDVRSMLDDMDKGIDKLDPVSIREAAARARQMAQMLGEEQAGKVNEAIVAAREAAREIVKRVSKKGEDAAVVLSEMNRGPIQSARIALMDLDDAVAHEGPSLPAINVQRFADALPDMSSAGA